MDAVLKCIGDNIRKARKEKNLTIEKMADIAGLSDKYLQGVEVGRRNISVTNLFKVAQALDVGLDVLVIMDSKYFSKPAEKINTISEKLKKFDGNQLDFINAMLSHIDTIQPSSGNLVGRRGRD